MENFWFYVNWGFIGAIIAVPMIFYSYRFGIFKSNDDFIVKSIPMILMCMAIWPVFIVIMIVAFMIYMDTVTKQLKEENDDEDIKDEISNAVNETEI